jgi:hypothetical protein
VDVVSLNYCTAVGLIQVEALPKHPLWVYARMRHLAKERSTTTVAATLDDLSNLKIGSGDSDEEQSPCDCRPQNQVFTFSNNVRDSDGNNDERRFVCEEPPIAT